MRNLKKFLAVVLALAMTFSLMVSASAAFTDADKIDSEYAESVAVLAGLGVFKGYTDGSFNPQGNITRAEVAAIIYRIATGDVEDKQAAMYAGSAVFSDVPTNEWYAGYVGFCANAGYVNGYEDGTFRPTANVTGFEALAMVLRAIGYDAQNEFSGAKWSDNIAWVANNRGITKDVKPGVLVAPASRELVAELLFETLLVDTVYYMPATGYRTADTSLGEKMFDLAAFEGVVTANEYADLYSDEALSAGKTEIDGKTYNLATDLTVLGMNVAGYAAGKDVLTIEATGNKVFETGEGTKINKTNTGLNVDNAEWYVNFDGGIEAYESDVRIKYVIKNLAVKYTVGTNTASVKYDYATDEKADDAAKAYFKALGVAAADIVEAPANTYTVAEITNTIAPGKAIYAEDIACMKLIFDEADLNEESFELGEVYVKTQSVDDISDEISWKAFKAEYLTEADKYASYTYSDNGEWLKVIDNDEDGKADYVFLTKFAMSKISDISKKGIYTLSALTNDGDNTACGFATSIDEDDMVTTSELAKGDIVLYTVIDGVYYVELAEVETNTVDKRGIDDKNNTVTCGETVYTKSGIDHADVMECDITDIDTQVSYDFYLDAFGYARMCEPSAWTKGFVLLVDGYHETDKRDTTFKAEIFNVETEDYEDVIVVDGKAGTTKDADNFIVVGGDKIDEGSWGRLKAPKTVYGLKSDFYTNIAGFSASEDGYTLIKIEDGSISNNAPYDDIAVVELTDLGKVTAKTLTAGTTDILATTETVYYSVTIDDGIEKILTWTGYANAPAAAVLADDAVAYAVTTESAKGEYDVAEIVVFESEETDPTDVYFVYDYTTYDAITVGYDDETEAYATDLYVDMYNRAEAAALAAKVDTLVDFFEISADGYFAEIDTAAKGEYAAEGIFAATALTDEDVDARDYVKVAREGAKVDYFKETSVPVYVIKGAVGDWDIAESKYGVEINDKLIMVYNADDELEYVINATQSDYLDTDAYVTALWNKIALDAQPAAKTYTITVLNYVEGMDFALEGATFVKTENGAAIYTAPAGTYDLNVKTIVGYDAATYYVTNDKQIVAEATPAGRYNIVVDSNTIVEIVANDLTETEYTITYNYDGGSVATANPTKYTVTTKAAVLASIKAPTKAGYTLKSWVATGADANGLGNLTYTATWEANEYTLTVKYFNAEGQLVSTWNTTEKTGTEYTVALNGAALIEDEYYGASTGYPVAIVDEDVVVEVYYVDEVTVTADTQGIEYFDGYREGSEDYRVWTLTCDEEVAVDDGKVEVEVAQTKGYAGQNETKEITYTVTVYDEVVFEGTVQVKIVAGAVTSPVEIELPELLDGPATIEISEDVVNAI